MIYDGDCSFCTRWVRRWESSSAGRVEFLPYQDPRVGREFPELPIAECEKAVQLIAADGVIYSGAEAVFRALASNPARGRWLRWYLQSNLFACLAEGAYRFVAKRRSFFSWLTRAWDRATGSRRGGGAA